MLRRSLGALQLRVAYQARNGVRTCRQTCTMPSPSIVRSFSQQSAVEIFDATYDCSGCDPKIQSEDTILDHRMVVSCEGQRPLFTSGTAKRFLALDAGFRPMRVKSPRDDGQHSGVCGHWFVSGGLRRTRKMVA